MSYQVLARKWRPKTFSQLVGQETTVRVLSNALANQQLHHAYLFTGTRGVGKTTIARIFAKSLNCHQRQTADPCGQCEVCTAIDQGRFVDLIEVDAASRTKVDETRELLDNVQYAPTQGDYKVYLIDEVHMFSKHSFNALLKTLEEPPPHVKFLLATTDPDKLPATILSRCLQFYLKHLSETQIKQQLVHILRAEQIGFEEAGLDCLAQSAQGSMRDALSLLDQAIAYGKGEVKAQEVRLMLGIVKQQAVIELLQLLIQRQTVAVIDKINEISEYTQDFFAVLQELLGLLHQIALAQLVQPNQQADINALASSLSPQDLQLYYQIAIKGKQDLPLAVNPKAGFEMMILRMLAFHPLEMRTYLQASSQASSPQPASNIPLSSAKGNVNLNPNFGNNIEQSQTKPVTDEIKPTQTPITTEMLATSSLEQTSQSDQAPSQTTDSTLAKANVLALRSDADNAQKDINDAVKNVISSQDQTDTLPPVVQGNSIELKQTWNELIIAMDLTSMIRELAVHCVLDKLEHNQFYLILEQPYYFLAKISSAQKGLLRCLKQYFNNDSIKLSVKVGDINDKGKTLFAIESEQKQQRQQQAEQDIKQDHFVQEVEQELDGIVLTDTIRPHESE